MTPTPKEQVAAEALARFDRPVDWYVDGKPITLLDCIRQQCGDLALSYAEAAYRAALATTPSPAVSAEPVAWRHRFGPNQPWWVTTFPSPAKTEHVKEQFPGFEEQPLYTHPKAEPAGVPEGWQLRVREDESQSWLEITGPQGQGCAFGVDRGSVRAEVLQEFNIAMLAAAPTPQDKEAECLHGVSDGACKQCYATQDKEADRG